MAEKTILIKCWGKNTGLLDAVCHWEGLWLISIIQYLHHHAVMELLDDRDELIRAAKLFHDLP